MNCWRILGIARTRDRGDIRRAYAAKLKLTNPEDDAEGFKRLRAAYEQALAQVDHENADATVELDAPVPGHPKLSPEVVEHDEPANAQHADWMEHGIRLERLRLSLQGNVNEDERLDAFAAVMTSKAMDALDIWNETEMRVAWLLAHTVPHSDGLLALAVDHFDWNSHDALVRKADAVRFVLQRIEDITCRDDLASKTHKHHSAFKVLSSPPRPITLRSRFISPATPEAIEAFFNTLGRSRPMLINDLNAEAVEAWRTFLARPQIPTWGLWSLALTAPALLLGILFLTVIPSDFRDWGIWTLLPPTLGTASLAYTLVANLPRPAWRAKTFKKDELWLRWGWAMATAILLLVTALPTEGWILTPLAVFVAIIAGTWVVALGEPDRRPGRLPWQIRAFLSEFYLVAWGGAAIVTLPPPAGIAIATIVATTTLVSAFGRIPMHRLWSAQPIMLRRMTALGVAASAAVAILALWAMQPFPELQPASIAMVAAVMLLHRGILPSIRPATFYIRYFMAVSFMLEDGAAAGQALVPAGGTLLLSWIFFPIANLALTLDAPSK